MVRSVWRDELAGISVVLIPRLLASIERTRVGIALGFEIENSVDNGSCTAISDPKHNTVLV